jgi:D-sedoheptulose 7-phosphate isomerase
MSYSKYLDVIQYKRQLLKKLISEEENIHKISNVIFYALKKGKKIMLCGNGGSAADAQHLAAEFLVRLRPKINRKPLAAISLAQDTSTITACGNDYKFDDIFSRNLRALGKKGDILLAISTSGNSSNIIKVLKEAKRMNIKTISLLGTNGGFAKKLSQFKIIVPSSITARIQEMQIFLGHYIFECIENLILKK